MAYLSRARRLGNTMSNLENELDNIKDEIQQIEDNEKLSEEQKDKEKTTWEDNLETAKSNATSGMEELKEEIENWRDGLQGTNLENSEKYSLLEECCDELEGLISEIEDIDIDNLECPDSCIDFPGMYS